MNAVAINLRFKKLKYNGITMVSDPTTTKLEFFSKKVPLKLLNLQ